MARRVGDHLIGKLGNTVTSLVNGQEITRIHNSDPYDPFTIGQRIQRSKMKFANKFLKTLKRIIKIGYQATTYDNPYNEAKSHICTSCFRVQSTNITVLYENILISRGLLAKAENCELQFTNEKFTLTWNIPDAKSGISGDDAVNLVMYSDVSDGQQWIMLRAARRSDGSISDFIPKSNLPVHFWIFFHNGDLSASPSKNNISNSVYVGSYPENNNEQLIDALTYVTKKKK